MHFVIKTKWERMYNTILYYFKSHSRLHIVSLYAANFLTLFSFYVNQVNLNLASLYFDLGYSTTHHQGQRKERKYGILVLRSTMITRKTSKSQ